MSETSPETTRTQRSRLRGFAVPVAFIALACFAGFQWFKVWVLDHPRKCVEVQLDAEDGKGWRLYTEVQYPFQIPFSLAEYTVIYDRTDDGLCEPVALFSIREVFQEPVSNRPAVEKLENKVTYRSECGVVNILIPDGETAQLPTIDIRPRSRNDAGYFKIGGSALSEGPKPGAP